MDDASDSVASFFRKIRQGHVFSAAGPDGEPEQLVVLSQTCDVVLAKRPTVTFAKVVTVAASDQSAAMAGAMPRYVRLPSLSGYLFADMSFIETRAKEAIAGAEYVEGIDLSDDDRRRDFALAVTRWFGRFPFPDEVVPWLQPVERIIREKYDRQGALGKLLREVVVELRVETNWASSPYALELHTIVRAETLASIEDEPSSAPAGFIARLRADDGKIRTPTAIADIYASTDDPLERSLALDEFATSLAAVCRPHMRHRDDASVMNAVTSVEGRLWADDEFPLSRVRKSEPLDLEYLSEPSSD